MTLQSQMVLYLRLINLEADMPGYNCSAQCFEAWYAAHLSTCITQSSRL